jgi:hypothetical protein
MPRGILTKVDIINKVYRLKNDLNNNSGRFYNFSPEKRDGANLALNEVLDAINEFYQ